MAEVDLNINVRFAILGRYIYLTGHFGRTVRFIIWAMTVAFAPRHGSHG